MIAVSLLLLLAACGGGGGGGSRNVVVTIDPFAAAVVIGQTIQFSATVSNTSNQSVNWEVNGVAGGDAAHGTISAGGLYTAPAAVPSPVRVTVTAVSQADTNQSDSSTVTVLASSNFSNATLNGQYAFSYVGSDTRGFLAEAGSITADGNGHITAGQADINSGSGVTNPTNLSGTYRILADGRGTITLGSETWKIAMMNGTHGVLVRFDDGVATGSGTIDKQTTSAFNNAAFNGPFVANLAGIDSANPSLPLVQGAVLALNGSGTISSGHMDANDNGGVQLNLSATGTYNIAGNGRGTITLSGFGTQHFAVYVVDTNHLKVVETDTVPVVAGDLSRGAASPGNNLLNGGYAFTTSGATLTGPLGIGGVLTADGSGVFTNGTGTLDINDGNAPTTGQTISNGSYSIAANGRGTLTLNLSGGFSLSYAIYPLADGSVVFTDISGAQITSGVAYPQSGLPFSNNVAQGRFALNWAGALFSGGRFIGEDIGGQLTVDTANSLLGILDINAGGSTSRDIPTTGGSVTPSSNGRGTMSVQTGIASFSHQIYVVDPNTILILDVERDRVVTGVLKRQS